MIEYYERYLPTEFVDECLRFSKLFYNGNPQLDQEWSRILGKSLQKEMQHRWKDSFMQYLFSRVGKFEEGEE